MLDLNGDSDNDNFAVRSFAALPLNDDGTVINETQANVTIAVCGKNGTNNSEEDFTCGDNNLLFEAPPEPDYVVNSLVDVDGGTGSDRLTIVGTEFADKYVIQDGKVFGGGLTVKFTNINFLDGV